MPSPLLALHLASAQLCCVFEHQEWKLFRFPLRISPHQHAALGRRACLQLQDMHIDQSFPFVTLHPAIDFNCSLLKRKHSVDIQLPTMTFLLFHTFLPGGACAQLSRAVDLSPSQPAAICRNYAAVNLRLLNQFLILCDSFPCRMISHFSGLFLRCHVSFFFSFSKGWWW